MTSHPPLHRLLLWTVTAVVTAASGAVAQSVTPTVSKPDSTGAATVAPSPSPVSGIRGKISADDLLSAESILEVHRQKYGDGGAYVNGLAWLARGALLVGDTEKALRYSREVRAICAARLASGADLTKDQDLETALGAAIEVEAQMIARASGAEQARQRLLSELDRLPGPVALRSRLTKRINLLTLTGTPAPELTIEDFIGDRPPLLASLRGKPVVLFLWAEWCGDCKAQAAALSRIRKSYAGRDLQVLTVTRYYDEAAKRATEKARVDSVWKAVYSEVGDVPMVVSTASMERYGGSSTPTYIFVDRAGVVRRYAPSRLTEAEFDKALAVILE